ncbi:MAG: hypothetical protein MZV64_63215 [Ignavibacteriales bacterium]|nr:hypothetical protein [Ignavibacteriales bacterium]
MLTPRSPWARCSAAGASSRPWARRSPSSSPIGGFCAETAGAITLFLATDARASRSPRPTPSPAPSSASARPRAPVGRPLGRGRQDRLGLDLHHPRRRADGRTRLRPGRMLVDQFIL